MGSHPALSSGLRGGALGSNLRPPLVAPSVSATSSAMHLIFICLDPQMQCNLLLFARYLMLGIGLGGGALGSSRSWYMPLAAMPVKNVTDVLDLNLFVSSLVH